MLSCVMRDAQLMRSLPHTAVAAHRTIKVLEGTSRVVRDAIRKLQPASPSAESRASALAACASRRAMPHSAHRVRRPPAAGRLPLAMSSDGADPFAAATVRAQRINYAFIAACVPGILPYQEAVDSFVATTIECLAEGVSIGALDLTLSQTQSTGNADVDRALGFGGSGGRQFQAEEVGLRRQWILFVYAAALAVGSHAPEFSSPADLATLRYVRNLYENFYQRGQRDLSSINLEMTFNVAGTEEAAKTPTEKAMLSQAVRFALAAFDQLSLKKRLDEMGSDSGDEE